MFLMCDQFKMTLLLVMIAVITEIDLQSKDLSAKRCARKEDRGTRK